MLAHSLGCAAKEPTGRHRLEVADIFRAHGPAYLAHHLVSPSQRPVIQAILSCRTQGLGGHVDVCDTCGLKRVSYNSCRNRHCPKCQSLAQARWLAERKERILPVAHFHVVFTLPGELRALALRNPETIYDLLFEAASKTLLGFAKDPKHLGAQLGITQVLHTWTRDLSYHPHLHCIVTSGGLSLEGTRWIQKSGRFLFPVRALSQVFRARFLSKLTKLYQQGALCLSGRCAGLKEVPAFEVFRETLFQKDWVVYAKRPFGGAQQVYSYLGRYTHRVGLSNQRLLHIGPDGVCFRTKHGQTTTLLPQEFIRRFLLHVLPRGFVKIRHYGLLSSTNAKTKLSQVRRLLSASTTPGPKTPVLPVEKNPAPKKERPDFRTMFRDLTGIDLSRCPLCQKGRMLRFLLVRSSSPGLHSLPIHCRAAGAAFADTS